MSPNLAGPSDWAVPHASRLKYRQQFNSLDKQMFGYLTGKKSLCVYVKHSMYVTAKPNYGWNPHAEQVIGDFIMVTSLFFQCVLSLS